MSIENGPWIKHVSNAFELLASMSVYLPTCAPPMYRKKAYALKIHPMLNSEYPCSWCWETQA